MIILFLKDLGAARPFWIPSLAIYIIIAASYFRGSIPFLLVNVFLTFACVVLTPVLDDKYRVDAMFCSLPVRRSEVVLARYLASFALILLGLLLYLALGNALGALFSGYTARALPSVSLAGVLIFLILTIGLTLLFLPLYFGLGLGRAALAFPVALAVTVAVLWALFRLISLAMDIPIIPTTDQEKALVEERLQAFQGADMELLLWKARIAGMLVLTLLLAGLTWISAALSIRLFRRRDL